MMNICAKITIKHGRNVLVAAAFFCVIVAISFIKREVLMASKIVVRNVIGRKEVKELEKKLLNYLANFQLSDLIGFARILDLPEQDDFQEFLTDIICEFGGRNRKERKNLLRLARDISKNNISFVPPAKQEGD